MKQKFLREHIPLFEAEDNEELVECLLVMGINSFLESHGSIAKGSGRPLRSLVGRRDYQLRTNLSWLREAQACRQQLQRGSRWNRKNQQENGLCKVLSTYLVLTFFLIARVKSVQSEVVSRVQCRTTRRERQVLPKKILQVSWFKVRSRAEQLFTLL